MRENDSSLETVRAAGKRLSRIASEAVKLIEEGRMRPDDASWLSVADEFEAHLADFAWSVFHFTGYNLLPELLRLDEQPTRMRVQFNFDGPGGTAGALAAVRSELSKVPGLEYSGLDIRREPVR
jgi:hypothetical protein